MEEPAGQKLSFLTQLQKNPHLENITHLNKRATGLLLSGCHRSEKVDIDELYKHRRLFKHIQKYRSTAGTGFGPLTQKQLLAVPRCLLAK